MNQTKVLILGAGVTGLAAGWKLLKESSAFEVTLLEQDLEPGVLAKTLLWNGYRLDLGPHRFHTDIPEIRDFIRTFCESSMERVARSSRMYLNGRYLPYPISPLPTFQALGLRQSVAFFFSALQSLFQGRASHDCSYEEYVRRYYGDALYRRIFEPFAQKVWGVPPSRLDGEVARVRLRGDTIWHALLDGLFSRHETYVAQFLYPPGGIGEIPKQFAREIESRGGRIVYGHSVESIVWEENRVAAVATRVESTTRTWDCDILISTIPLPCLVAMARPAFPEPVRQAAESLRFRALVLLYLIWDKPMGIQDTWLYYPENHVPFSRISVPENFTGLNKATGKTCLCLEFPCEKNDATWNAESSTLARAAETILIDSGLVDAPAADVLKVPLLFGYPLYTRGYSPLLERVLAHLQQTSNCLVAGRQGLFRHNNTDQSMQMGLLAAEQVLHHPDRLPDWYDGVARFNDYRIVD